MKKHFLLLLALVISASAVFASCSESGNTEKSGSETTLVGDETSPTAVDETSASAEETEADLIDVLSKNFTPELKAELELDGYESRVFLRQEGYEWSNPDIVAEEQTGERLNDAVYNRNLYLEDTYGFTIMASYSEWDCSELTILAASGDDIYDMVFPMARTAASMAQAGVLIDLNTVPYLDFDNPTWSRMFIDLLKLDGKLYYAAGDISVNSLQAVIAMLFNKQMVSNYHLSDPYTLVREGSWTLDNFKTMCTTAAEDLNGDGNRTPEDQWGMILQSSKGGIAFYYGCDEHLVDLNEEEIPHLSAGNERSVNVYKKIQELVYDKSSVYEGGDYETLGIFAEGRSLFTPQALFHTITLREAETEFGIVPMPKYDTEQDEYVQCADGWCISPLVIPAIVENIKRAGFIAEAFAEASSVMVKPEYYEIILKSKLTRDQESAEMLDIIYKNFVVDPADLYQWGGLEESIIKSMRNGQEISSVVAKGRRLITKNMENTLNEFAAHN